MFASANKSKYSFQPFSVTYKHHFNNLYILKTGIKQTGITHTTTHLSLHHADDLDVEVLQVLLVVQVKLVPPALQGHAQPLRPVLVTFDPSPLHFLGHHGDDVGFALPDHLPEGGHGGGQRALAGDVEELRSADLHADVAGVDVVLIVSNGNTGFVIYGGKDTVGGSHALNCADS